MADAETPVTDIEALHSDLHELVNRLAPVLSTLDVIEARLTALDTITERVDSVLGQNAALNEMVAKLVTSHNQVGENVAWLVANTQGIFQMLNSPDMMNQIMSAALGGGLGGGRPQPAEQPVDGG